MIYYNYYSVFTGVFHDFSLLLTVHKMKYTDLDLFKILFFY